MTHDLPRMPHDDDNLAETVANDGDNTRAYQPAPVARPDVPRGGHVTPTDARAQRRPPQNPTRPARVVPMSGTNPRVRQKVNQSALYLPWWSLVVMLLVVMFATFLIVGSLYLLRGSVVADATQEPIIRIITAVPTQSDVGAGQDIAPASTQIITSSSETNLILTGPTLAPVLFTPTPQPITVGSAVVVTGVGNQALNIRDRAGTLGTNVLFRLDDGTRLIVVDGPTQADGFTWWQVQDVNNASQTGWAVANYLDVAVD